MKEKIDITVNQEDVQNIIDCYEKDIELIEKLKERIDKAIEYIDEYRFDLELPSRQEELLEILKGEKE